MELFLIVYSIVFVPYITVICEIIALIRTFINKPLRGFGRFVKKVGPFAEMIMLVVGIYLEEILLLISDYVITGFLPVIIIVTTLFIAARMVLGFAKPENLPRAGKVLSMVILCLGDIFAIVFTIVISPAFIDNILYNSYFFIIPVNLILLSIRILWGRSYLPSPFSRGKVSAAG